QGWSLARIATHIGVSKRTLIDWNREFHSEIRALEALETEALHERILASHERELTQLAKHQTDLENELSKRNPKVLSTLELFRMSALVRRQIHDLRQSKTAVPPAGSADVPVGSPSNNSHS